MDSKQQRLFIWASPLILATTLATAGCVKQSPPHDRTSPTQPNLPSTSPQQIDKWYSLDSKCPSLTGKAAKSINLPPETYDVTNRESSFSRMTTCIWKSSSRSVEIDLRLSLEDGLGHPEMRSAMQFELLERGSFGKDEFLPEPNLGDEAHSGIGSNGLQFFLVVRSSNIAFLITYQPGSSVTSSDQSSIHRETMRGLAEDVLNDLR